jgi:hypothetical protein
MLTLYFKCRIQFYDVICFSFAKGFAWKKQPVTLRTLQECFDQTWCKIEIHVGLSWILIFLQARFSQFYPSYTLFYQKKTPSLLVSIITTTKIFLDSNCSFEDRKLNEIWRMYWVVTIRTIHFNALFSFLYAFQTLKSILSLYFVVGQRFTSLCAL